jgi:hypothetical protein
MNITSDSNSNATFTFSRSDLTSDNIQNIQNVHNEQNNSNFQTGGGLFCKDDFTKILLECFSDDRPDIVCYLLSKLNHLPKDLTMNNEIKRNIFHYLTIYASHNNMVIHLSRILRECDKDDIEDALNSQDNAGNTPLHYATFLGYNNLVKLYIKYGASCEIKNNKGEYVQEDNSTENNESLTQPEIHSVTIIKVDPENVLPEDIRNTFSFRREQIESESEPVPEKDVSSESFVFNRNLLDTIKHEEKEEEEQDHQKLNDDLLSSVRTDHFLREVSNALRHQNKMVNSDRLNTTDIFENIVNDKKENIMLGGNLSDTSINTADIMNNILEHTKKNKDQSNEINPLNNGDNLSINTADIINNIITKTNIVHPELQGGGKKSKSKSKKSKSKHSIARIHGERVISTLSEKSVTVSSSHQSRPKYEKMEKAVDSDGSDISDIARQISRQSSDIHERAVMKIIEILKLDKNNQNDVQKARNYKAAIYKMIKEKNPLLNNFDRAVEMEKSITKETLAKIDITKVSQEIEKHMSEKPATSASKSTESTVTASSVNSKSTKSDKTTKSAKQSRTKHKQYDESSITFTSNLSSSDSNSEFSSESN